MYVNKLDNLNEVDRFLERWILEIILKGRRKIWIDV